MYSMHHCSLGQAKEFLFRVVYTLIYRFATPFPLKGRINNSITNNFYTKILRLRAMGQDPTENCYLQHACGKT